MRHSLYKGNDAAASRELGLEFVICQQFLVVLNKSQTECRPLCRLQVGSNGGSSHINYVRVGILAGKEFLGICCEDNLACVWPVALIAFKAYNLVWDDGPDALPPLLDLKPLITIKTLDSTWGIAFHPSLPLIAVSDNSQTITLSHGFRPRMQMRIRNLGGNIPSLDFIQAKHQLIDAAPVDENIYLAFATLDTRGTDRFGSAGVWQLDLARVAEEPDYVGKLLYKQRLLQEGWTVRGLSRHCALHISEFPWAKQYSDRADSYGYAQLHSLLDIPSWNNTKDPSLDETSLPSWLAVQESEAQRKIARVKGTRLPHIRKKLAGTLLLTTTSSHVLLCRASEFHCQSVARFSAGTSVPIMRMSHAITITEVIEPLSLVICVARGGKTMFFRIVESLGYVGLVHEHSMDVFGRDEVTGLTAYPEVLGQLRGPWILKLWNCVNGGICFLKLYA